MKRKRYSVEQIVAAVKQQELGTPVTDIVRKLRVAEQTFYRWKSSTEVWKPPTSANSRGSPGPRRPRPLRQRARAGPGDGLRLGQREGRLAGARHALGRRPRRVGEDGRGADSDGRKRLVFDAAIRSIPKTVTTSATVNVGPGSTCPTRLFVA